MPIVPTIDSSKLRDVARKVKEIDPGIKKEMVAGLKSDLQPYASQIAGTVPNPALSGFVHTGRTQWSPVKASVYVTPGGGKGSVARIEVYGSPERAAFKLADRAGTRDRGRRQNRGYSRQGPGGVVTVGPFATTSGDFLIRALSSRYPLSAGGRGGRFAWAAFMRFRPQFLSAVVSRLDRYAQRVGEKVVD
jgi:hypothetical protein